MNPFNSVQTENLGNSSFQQFKNTLNLKIINFDMFGIELGQLKLNGSRSTENLIRLNFDFEMSISKLVSSLWLDLAQVELL